MSWAITEPSKSRIHHFPKKYTPTYRWNHQVLYYDFLHHHPISRIDWEKEMKHDFDDHLYSISEKILWTSQFVQESITTFHKQFFEYIYLYTSHLMYPLFREDHYEQFKKKHIWVFWKRDNIVFAFTFSPEEMSLYKNMESLAHTWKERHLS
jgi:hypothetical protein